MSIFAFGYLITLLAEVFYLAASYFVVFLWLTLPLLFSGRQKVKRLRKRSGKMKPLLAGYYPI